MKKLERLDPHPLSPHVPSSNNRTGLSHWKGKPVIALEDRIQIRGQLRSRLDYFPDDFDQTLTYMELPYYRYEFERKKRRLEAKRRQDGWLNDEVGYGSICHDSRGNLVDGLGNPIKEAEEVVAEEEVEQDRDEELRPKLQQDQEDIEKWNSDFEELMEYTKNSNYGKVKCFHCLLSPTGDDPIFIGINRLVAKGLIDMKQYPCEIVNRFQCPYESAMNSAFDVEDLFRLEKMAFAIEISLAKARKEDSMIRIRNKEELLHALKDKETFTKILKQGAEAPEVSEYIRTYLAENRNGILNHFMKIRDKVNMEELRFY